MQKIWQTYKYIYYWLYTWQRKLWGKYDVPEFNAVVGMSLSFLAIFFSLIALMYIIAGIEIIPDNIPKIEMTVFLLCILGIHYFMFMYKGKYKEIEKEFKKESKKERKKKGVWVLLYAFGSLALYIFLLFFGIWIKS